MPLRVIITLLSVVFAINGMSQALAQSGAGMNLRFERIGIEQGLSQNSVNWIMQDSQGFMWFATQDGLNKFDGYTFVVYRHSPDDDTSISHNYLTSIAEDSRGNLWVAT